jgi:hypothetical protein
MFMTSWNAFDMFLFQTTSWATKTIVTWPGVECGDVIILIAQWKDLQQLYCPLKVRMRRRQKMFDLSDYGNLTFSRAFRRE